MDTPCVIEHVYAQTVIDNGHEIQGYQLALAGDTVAERFINDGRLVQGTRPVPMPLPLDLLLNVGKQRDGGFVLQSESHSLYDIRLRYDVPQGLAHREQIPVQLGEVIVRRRNLTEKEIVQLEELLGYE